MKKHKDGGYIVEPTEKELNKLLEIFDQDDPNCRFKRGERVKKIVKENENERHKLGEEGIVIGTDSSLGFETYLIDFKDSDAAFTFIMGDKLDRV